MTQSQADKSLITTARLPINEFMKRAEKGSYNQILSANQGEPYIVHIQIHQAYVYESNIINGDLWNSSKHFSSKSHKRKSKMLRF